MILSSFQVPRTTCSAWYNTSASADLAVALKTGIPDKFPGVFGWQLAPCGEKACSKAVIVKDKVIWLIKGHLEMSSNIGLHNSRGHATGI